MVAIVGKPNVGKSALFNRLAGMNIAIVHDRPGVTRDRLIATCFKGSSPFDIMDTGGIGATLEDDFGAQVQAEARLAMDVADLIVFVVDGFEGLTPVDLGLADTLRRTPKPLVLVVNKMDSVKRTHHGAEAAQLGFKDRVETSAEHGLGIETLLGLIGRRLDLASQPRVRSTHSAGKSASEPQEAPLKLAIVGRPNAGKSSLINAILGQQRTIVSPIPGTTRDAIDIPCTVNGREYVLIDTAGLRRKAKIQDAVETFSAHRATQSIKRADLCMLILDCAAGASMQDRKIAGIIVELGKPCILVLNKFDLFHPNGKMTARVEELEETMGREFFFMRYAPMIPASAKTGQYLDKIFNAVEGVRKAAQNQPGTGVLNRLLQRAIERNTEPLGQSGRAFKLLYATIAGDDHPSAIPSPHIVLFGNRTEKLQESYLRYLEDCIRKEWKAEGIPFRISVRGKPKRDSQDRGKPGMKHQSGDRPQRES